MRIAAEDVERNRRLGAHGAELLPEDARVLTHCNTGSLACVGYGTALGVIRAAHETGRRPSVWVDETRPVLQGARLTAWELQQLGIPCTLVADAMAGALMAAGEVDAVIVGADRIAANGDVANKIGTYGLAVLAGHHGHPVLRRGARSRRSIPRPRTAPRSRSSGATGRRSPSSGGRRVAPEGVAVENRAFDVTPAALVTAYVSEEGDHAAARPRPALDLVEDHLEQVPRVEHVVARDRAGAVHAPRRDRAADRGVLALVLHVQVVELGADRPGGLAEERPARALRQPHDVRRVRPRVDDVVERVVRVHPLRRRSRSASCRPRARSRAARP